MKLFVLDKKTAVRAAAAVVLMGVFCLLMPMKIALAAGAVLGVLCAFRLPGGRLTPVWNLMWLAGFICAVVIVCQPMAEGTVPWHVNPDYVLVAALLTAAVLLLPAAIGGRVQWAIPGAVVLGALCLVNGYVSRFRGNAFNLTDFAAVSAAANVLSGYSLRPSARQMYGIMVFVILIFSAGCLPKYRTGGWTRAGLAAAAVAAAVLFGVRLRDVPVYNFSNSGAILSMYLTNFSKQSWNMLELMGGSRYSDETVEQLEQTYGDAERSAGKRPSIIVIMNESFADLRIAGDVQTEEPMMPFFDSLTEDTIKGYALSSVFGGGTSNSEYEFLTGNTLGFYPDMNMYQMAVKASTYSMARDLASLGYRCAATHPFQADSWGRDKVWPLLGFDTTTYLEDYPERPLLRDFYSDRDMYEYVISCYEQERETPLFLFGVTIQNHGGYDYTGPNDSAHLGLSGSLAGKWPSAEQYLGLIRESDRALEGLVEYFRGVSEPVVVVFFGDHLPNLSGGFYDALHGGFNDLAEQQLLYTVPFLIWANYDIPEQTLSLTSLNYLSSYVYEAAGIDKPPYLRFLTDVRAQVPAINHLGCLSASTGKFCPRDQLPDGEKRWIDNYWMLEYNSIFRRGDASKVFFPNA